MSSISVKLAAAFFGNAGMSEHTVGLYVKTPQLMEALNRCANGYWDHIWWQETHPQRMAREAIGNIRFHHPEAIQAYAGFPFTKEELTSLDSVPFSPERLSAYSGSSGYMLMADPGLSILEMKGLAPQEFFSDQHHYVDWECARRKEPPAWVLVGTDPCFRECDFAEQEQRRQEEGDLLLLSARRLTFAMLALKLCHGTRYFWNAIVRTSDTVRVWDRREQKEKRVTVGYDVHGADVGICIDTWEDHVTAERIGIGIEVNPKQSPLL